jgi:hypothetical protein
MAVTKQTVKKELLEIPDIVRRDNDFGNCGRADLPLYHSILLNLCLRIVILLGFYGWNDKEKKDFYSWTLK